MPEHTIHTETDSMVLPQILKSVGLTSSTSEGMRMIEQGAVRLNGEKVSDKALILSRGQQVVLQIGRRKFARVTLA